MNKVLIDLLKKYNVVLERPLELVIPCRNCHESEVYRIYKDHYVFVENKKKKPPLVQGQLLSQNMSRLISGISMHIRIGRKFRRRYRQT